MYRVVTTRRIILFVSFATSGNIELEIKPNGVSDAYMILKGNFAL